LNFFVFRKFDASNPLSGENQSSSENIFFLIGENSNPHCFQTLEELVFTENYSNSFSAAKTIFVPNFLFLKFSFWKKNSLKKIFSQKISNPDFLIHFFINQSLF